MKAIVALLLTLAACHARVKAHPSRSAAARQLVQIVPVTRDGDPAPAAPPALAYILPASEESRSDSEEALEEEDKEGEQDDLQEVDEAAVAEDIEDDTQARSVDSHDTSADDDDVIAPPVELRWGALRPAYHLSFVFGR